MIKRAEGWKSMSWLDKILPLDYFNVFRYDGTVERRCVQREMDARQSDASHMPIHIYVDEVVPFWVLDSIHCQNIPNAVRFFALLTSKLSHVINHINAPGSLLTQMLIYFWNFITSITCFKRTFTHTVKQRLWAQKMCSAENVS